MSDIARKQVEKELQALKDSEDEIKAFGEEIEADQRNKRGK